MARENLGTFAGLLAAAALSLDYVLNVAVAISAGVAALVSMADALQPYTVALCLAILAIVTLMNLRGTGEPGWAFSFPTYLFIASLGGMVIVGVFKAIVSGGQREPVDTPPKLPEATAALGFWLLIRAFASGCTAMTGVEAVSNGVSAFREPIVPNARRTLAVVVGVLAVLLGGIGYLARAYQIGAMDQDSPGYQSVLSQLTAAVFGRGMLYYITMGSVLAVLCLSANTSFVDFPRLCRLLARDDFLPRIFGIMGRRLVYSGGILFLAAAAAVLLIVFGGITDRLIPLFAVGAFLAFTLSQTGMVLHGWRQRRSSPDDGQCHRRGHGLTSLFINAVGAVSTACALAVIVLAKFTEGAWITLLAIPLLITLFYSVKRHYYRTEKRLWTQRPLDLQNAGPPIVILPTTGWNKLTREALRFAMQLSPDVIAVHLGELNGDEADAEEDRTVREGWERNIEAPARAAGAEPPRLQIINSHYRQFIEPLLAFIRQVQQDSDGRTVAVLIPELVEGHWWQRLLHNHRGAQLRRALLSHGERGLVVMALPWHIDPAPAPPTPEEPPHEAIQAAQAAIRRTDESHARDQSVPAALGCERNSRRPQAS